MISRAISKALIAAITTIFLVGKTSSMQCDKKKCDTPIRIVFEEEIDQIVAIKDTKVEVMSWPNFVEVVYTDRRRYTMYCYQGTMLDPNTGCTRKERHVPFNRTEVTESIKMGYCRTGYECGMGECWGSDSNKCLTDQLVNLIGPTKYQNFASSNDYFARHTCTSRWYCRMHKVMLQTTIKETGREITAVLHTPEHDTIVLKSLLKQGLIENPDQSTYYYIGGDISPLIYKTKAKCYSSSPKHVKCVLKIDGKETTFNINEESMTGAHRATHIRVLDPIKTVNNGKISLLTIPEENSIQNALKKSDESDNMRGASIEGLKEIIDGVTVQQMQGLFNVMSNRRKVIEVERMLHNLIKTLSQKDDLLLSRLLGGHYSTHWLNKEIFQMCPCQEEPNLPIYTNCHNGFLYEDGIYQKISHDYRCQSINEKDIKNISIGNPKPYVLDTKIIDYEPPRTSSSDSSTWDWLVNLKNSRFDSNSSYGSPENTKGLLDGISPGISVDNIIKYFCLAVCLLYVFQATRSSLANRLF